MSSGVRRVRGVLKGHDNEGMCNVSALQVPDAGSGAWSMRALLALLLSSSAHSYSLRLSPKRAPSQPLLRNSRSSPPLSCAPAELPSKPLLGAITKLGGRVTASDVSAETGTSITETQRQLLVLARLVGAELVVADDGQLSFVFEDQAALRRGLRSATWRMRGREAWETVSPALAWTARASV